jgi:hypothetical protein
MTTHPQVLSLRALHAMFGSLLLMAVAAQTVLSQVPLTPRALGMGGAFNAVARGHESLFQNPANLGLPDAPASSVALLQLNANGSLLGVRTGDIWDLRDYNGLPAVRRTEIFERIPATGLAVDGDLLVPVVSIQVGPLAAGVSYRAIGDLSVARDVVELLMFGYTEGRGDYQVPPTAGSLVSFLDIAAAYGWRAGQLSFGITGHYIHGRSLEELSLLQPRLALDGSDIEVTAVGALARGGHGFGVDVGVAYQPEPSVTVAVAVTNAFAAMDWSDELRVRSVALRKDDFETLGLQDIFERYEASERLAGPADQALLGNTRVQTLQRQAYDPTTARIGAAWTPTPATQLGATFQTAITDGRLGGAWDRLLGVGVQQKLPLILLRAGVATNLHRGFMMATGLSLGPLDVALARLNAGDVDGQTRSGWIASAGLSLRGRTAANTN